LRQKCAKLMPDAALTFVNFMAEVRAPYVWTRSVQTRTIIESSYKQKRKKKGRARNLLFLWFWPKQIPCSVRPSGARKARFARNDKSLSLFNTLQGTVWPIWAVPASALHRQSSAFRGRFSQPPPSEARPLALRPRFARRDCTLPPDDNAPRDSPAASSRKFPAEVSLRRFSAPKDTTCPARGTRRQM